MVHVLCYSLSEETKKMKLSAVGHEQQGFQHKGRVFSLASSFIFTEKCVLESDRIYKP